MKDTSKINISNLQDEQSVTPEGKRVAPLPEGMTFKKLTTHVDDRGVVCELYDPRWGWHKDPLVFTYFFTLRPGHTKGWGLHKLHEDRYAIVYGEVEFVLYDAREESGTFGLVAKVVLSEYDRCLMNIPAGIWHANTNIGTKDAVIVNFPTQPYDHENPDKYRLPLDTDKIPYKFVSAKGW